MEETQFKCKIHDSCFCNCDLINGDCLEEMKKLDNDSIDLIFCDLPYGQTSCKWDCKIDLELFWKEVMRIKKLNTPIFFTTTTKFGVELIQSAPKKCFFRYDLVWVKSSSAGFLCAKKMPLRKHEMVYVFYEKLPFYDLSSHTHKFVKSSNNIIDGDTYNTKERKTPITREPPNKYDPPLPNSVVKDKDLCIRKENSTYGNSMITTKKKEDHQQKYDPPLPTSIVKEESGDVVVNEKYTYKQDKEKDLYGTDIRKEVRTGKNVGKSSIYDPPLPNSVIKGENNTYNTEGRKTPITREPPNKYDPPLPVSVVKEDKYCDEIINNNIIKDTKHGTNTYNTETGRKQPLKHTGSGAFGGEGACYDPPLPNSMLEIKSTRGKHSTEKPVALMEWILKYYSKEGDVVLDPTCGSGSTGVACKNMKRNFIGIEMDSEIFKMAQSRII